jgi:hypothetical protein
LHLLPLIYHGGEVVSSMSKVLALQGTFKTWSCNQDENGYRDYKITFLIQADVSYGPAQVLSCPGLPVVGSVWDFASDLDEFVYCKLNQNAKPIVADGPDLWWEVEFLFSNRPDLQKCESLQFTDPFLQCPRISGHSTKRTREATLDVLGNQIVNSAFEQIRGPHNEWDQSRTGVRIEMNTDAETVALAISYLDTVNDAILWGQDERCVKLSNVTWDKKYYGACQIYFSLILDFDIETYENGVGPDYIGPYWPEIPTGSWDRLVLDEGTKVLKGHYDPVTGAYQIDLAGGIHAPVIKLVQQSAITGTLAPGTYFYKVTAVTAEGLETNASPASSVDLALPLNSIVLTIVVVPGAASYNIYGRPSTLTGTYDLLGSTETGGNYVYNDVGDAPIGGAPPSTNQTLVAANPLNPQNFIQYRGPDGNVCKVMLNGRGLPADVPYSTGSSPGTITGPGLILIQYYPSNNFLDLGIPTDYAIPCVDDPPG